MPPRKRMRLSRANTPAAQSPSSAADPSNKSADEDVLNDPWTDDEEIGLFKALIRWKPTGIHKHFRMLQVREYLLDNSYIHPRSEHTTISGIWSKLASLYDLEALDQREDARQLSDVSDEDENGGEDSPDNAEDDVYSLAENRIHRESFVLPDDDYGELLWSQRFAQEPDRNESPPVMPELNTLTTAPISFTPTIEIPDEQQISSAPKKRGRPPKNASRTNKAAAPTSSTKRRSRRSGGSVEDGGEGEKEEIEDEGGSEGEELAEEVEEEEAEGEEEHDSEAASSDEAASTNRTRSSRGHGRSTTRGRPKGRRR